MDIHLGRKKIYIQRCQHLTLNGSPYEVFKNVKTKSYVRRVCHDQQHSFVTSGHISRGTFEQASDAQVRPRCGGYFGKLGRVLEGNDASGKATPMGNLLYRGGF